MHPKAKMCGGRISLGQSGNPFRRGMPLVKALTKPVTHAASHHLSSIAAERAVPLLQSLARPVTAGAVRHLLGAPIGSLVGKGANLRTELTWDQTDWGKHHKVGMGSGRRHPSCARRKGRGGDLRDVIRPALQAYLRGRSGQGGNEEVNHTNMLGMYVGDQLPPYPRPVYV